jgi:hypothetical protein
MRVIAMKGYTEERGRAFKLGFDVESGQFFSKPIAHDFAPEPKQSLIAQKTADWRKRRETAKAKALLKEQLSAMGPELRDDIGMSDDVSSALYV